MFKKNDLVTVAGYGVGTVVKDFGKKVRVKVAVGDTKHVPIVPKDDVAFADLVALDGAAA